jgi:glutathione reductase (NADPH)
VGLSEQDAAKSYDLDVFLASFRPMHNILAGRDEKMIMKLIADANKGTVLGIHILGPDAGEMAQVFGVAVKARLTKADFDRTMAVHPTAAEELVTMYIPTYKVTAGVRV